MTDAEYLARLIDQLVEGWPERVEYMIDVQVHTSACKAGSALRTSAARRHWQCRCPKRREARAYTARQRPLLVQLRLMAQPLTAAGQDNVGGRTAPGSRPPGSLQAVDLLGEIRDVTRDCRLLLAGEPRVLASRIAVELRELVTLASRLDHGDERAAETITAVRRLVRRARILLGYEAPMRQLVGTVCGQCGGALIVSADTDSDVRCVGTEGVESCGMIYRRWQWIDLLDQQGAPA